MIAPGEAINDTNLVSAAIFSAQSAPWHRFRQLKGSVMMTVRSCPLVIKLSFVPCQSSPSSCVLATCYSERMDTSCSCPLLWKPADMDTRLSRANSFSLHNRITFWTCCVGFLRGDFIFLVIFTFSSPLCFVALLLWWRLVDSFLRGTSQRDTTRSLLGTVLVVEVSLWWFGLAISSMMPAEIRMRTERE